MKVVYIMGAGHIGSTILDIAISTHHNIESLGELSKYHRFGWLPDDNRVCACGLSVYDCSFWGKIRPEWTRLFQSNDADRYIQLQKRYEGSRMGWLRLIIR